MAIRTHRDLIVWQRAMELSVEVRRLAERLPPSERHAIGEQLRRSVTSIAANIAEGYGRVDRGDFRRFISIARGSLMETATFVELAVRMSYVTSANASRATSLMTEVGNMLTSLSKALRGRQRPMRRSWSADGEAS